MVEYNSKVNQNCWNCFHFQRYGTGDTPDRLFGECRAKSITEQQSDSLFFSYNWSFIKDATLKWCGFWKKSTLTIPPIPALPKDPTWPGEFNAWVPWNVKDSMNISCWSCNHFQRDKEVPDTALGVCSKVDPNRSTNINNDTMADQMSPTKPWKYPGPVYWCGQWEKSVATVPTAPAVPAVPRSESDYLFSGGTVNYYVDESNGDDFTGDGSASKPFRTLSFMSNLPAKIFNPVRIRPTAGTYIGFPSKLDIEFFDEGKLIIDASAETFPVEAGPFTIGTVTNVGAAGPFGKSLAVDITVAAAGWTPDDYAGFFLRGLTGNWAGYVVPIYKNDTDTLTLPPDWETFQVGDTFEIVDCPVEIKTPNTILMRGNMSSSSESSSGGEKSESPYDATFLFCGIKFRANEVAQNKKPFRLENAAFVLSACILQNDYDAVSPNDKGTLELAHGSINALSLPNGTFDDDKFSDWTKYNLIVNKSTGISDPDELDISLVSSVLYTTMCRGAIWQSSENEQIGTQMTIVQCGKVLAYSPRSILDYLYIDQLSNLSTCIAGLTTKLKLLSCYIRNGGQPMILGQNSFCFSGWFQGTGITGNYALQIHQCSQFVLEDADTTILGAVGAIECLW